MSEFTFYQSQMKSGAAREQTVQRDSAGGQSFLLNDSVEEYSRPSFEILTGENPQQSPSWTQKESKYESS